MIPQILGRFKHTLIMDFEAVSNGDVFHVGAVFNGNTFEKKDIKDNKSALKELSIFSSGADYIMGHNIINHNLAIVKKVIPDGRELQKEIKDMEEERRLYYVAMTRSKKAVYAFRIQDSPNPHVRFLEQNNFVHVSTTEDSSINGFNEQLTVSILGLEDLFLFYAGLFPGGHCNQTRYDEFNLGDNLLDKHRYFFQAICRTGRGSRCKEQKDNLF